jgi:hypothetical protein
MLQCVHFRLSFSFPTYSFRVKCGYQLLAEIYEYLIVKVSKIAILRCACQKFILAKNI